MRHHNALTYLNLLTIAIIILITAAGHSINNAIIAPINSYFHAVWSGTEDPFWPHVVLVPLSVLAGLAVGFAILSDHPRFASRFSATAHTIALWCLVIGVPTESLVTILLFIVDERISLAQSAALGETTKRARIANAQAADANDLAAYAISRAATLEKEAADVRARAAQLDLDAANLKRENLELEQALTPRIVDQAALSKAVASLPRLPIFVAFEDRNQTLAKDIGSAFAGIAIGTNARWTVHFIPAQYPARGVEMQYLEGTPESKYVAVAICESLKSQGLFVSIKPFVKGEPGWQTEIPINSVVITVGDKPETFWLNKQLAKAGTRPVSFPSACTADELFEWSKEQQHSAPQK